jgi:hypothetical protein
MDWSLAIVRMRQIGTVLIIHATRQTGSFLAVHCHCLIIVLLVMSDRLTTTDSTVRETDF